MEFQCANLGRTTNGGLTICQPRMGLDPIVANNLGPDANYLFIPPFTHDPGTNNIWLGGNYLYRGPQFGLSWQKLGDAMPEGSAHVFRSIDNGQTWRSLDGSGPTGLPDIPVHSIVVDPDDRQRLYLGTDLGVMVSIDGGQTWMSEETGFGPAVTMWLSLIRTPAGQKQLFAFTHGRGAWRVTLR